MKLRFFVICFGADYADLFNRIALRSLTQPRNRAAIPGGATVALYTDEATLPLIHAESLGTVEPHVMALAENHYDTQNRAFIEEVGRCVQEDAALVIVNPDCFWGDGSLANLLAIAGEEEVCIAAPHLRVDRAAFLAGLPDDVVVDNPALVTLAMANLHQSWKDANPDAEESNTYHTGIALRRMAHGISIVSHLQPTVWFARLRARDYGFFAENANARGLWDHAWPTILVQDGRYRVVADSDAIFLAELTDAETHNTPLRKVDPKHPTEFCRNASHIAVNRTVIGIWRENTS